MPESLSLHRPVLVWGLLVVATLLSALLGGHGEGAARGASVAVLVVAFVKVRFVLLDFMELGGHRGPVRIFAEVWTAGVCAALVTWYLVGVA